MFSLSAKGAVVMGASAGGIEALRIILGSLPSDFVAPVFVVQHFPANATMFLPSILASECRLPVVEAADKAPIEGGCVYIAPPGHHLVENDGLFTQIKTFFYTPFVLEELRQETGIPFQPIEHFPFEDQ